MWAPSSCSSVLIFFVVLSILSVSGIYIRNRLFYPHSIVITYYVNSELIVRVCYVNCACARIHVVFPHIVVGNIDIRVFRTLCAILLFFLRIVLAVISGCLTKCRIVRMCVHILSYFANFRWFIWTISTNTVYCYIVCLLVLLSALCTIF